MKRIPAATRKAINKEFWRILKPTYFVDIPLSELFDVCIKNGFTPIQEDNTKWAGILCGADGQALFPLATNNAELKYNVAFYNERVDNAICVSWHKMESGRWEVIGYLS